ncbi:hypothetical protein [Actinokineospora sp.]|uniref:hypothetical protein n=1 Tax=Actinokineospora sp. TaxID=1872133 RepID=UPI0040384B33
MTAPDIDQEEIVEEDALEEDTTAEDESDGEELSAEDIELLQTALKKCTEEQPTVHLLPMEEEIGWHRSDGDQYFLSIGEYEVIVNVANGSFEAVDPEQIRQLLVAKLDEVHGADAVFDVGGVSRSIDWTTVQVVQEAAGKAAATATTLPDAEGETAEVDLSIDLEFAVTIGSAATAEEQAPPAVIDGAYLAATYGNEEYVFDGRSFVIDWTQWNTDNTTDEGVVGSETKATSDGETYDVYAWFVPGVGVEIVQATLAQPDGAAGDEPDGNEPDHGVTTAYLSEYYTDPIEHDGHSITVDYSDWDNDVSVAEDMVGSEVSGVDENGVRYELYIWFSVEDGPKIVTATALESDEPEQEETARVDPREHFDSVLVGDLRDVWSGNGNLLKDTSGKEYDVSAWLNGDSGSAPELVDFDGEHFYVSMRMSTTTDEPQRVRCALKVRDAHTVSVESEESA